MIKQIALTVCFSVVSSVAGANGFSLSVSDDAVDAAFNLAPIGEKGSAELRWLHNGSKDRDVLSAGFFVNGNRAELSGRLGVKGYWAEIDRDDGYGFALGGDFSLAVNDAISLLASGYWGPGSLSFSDVEGYKEWAVGANISVFENASVSLTYGSIKVDTERYGDKTVDDGIKIGLKLNY